MTYEQLAANIRKELTPIYGEDEARAIQRYLFKGIKNMSSAEWLMQYNEEAATDFVDKIITFIPFLKDHNPVQYLLGKVWFIDLEFEVSPDVLIPRPETEALVRMIVNEYDHLKCYRIIDIGTGSGAIAVSLAKLLSESQVTAIDISNAALDIAARNAKRHNVIINFLKKDILAYNSSDLEPITTEKKNLENKFDIIVSNPPYVKESEKNSMLENVTEYEPHLALFVSDKDPLIFYRSIINYAVDHLEVGGTLWFEINESEDQNLVQLLYKNGYVNVMTFHDFNDKPRYIKASK